MPELTYLTEKVLSEICNVEFIETIIDGIGNIDIDDQNDHWKQREAYSEVRRNALLIFTWKTLTDTDRNRVVEQMHYRLRNSIMSAIRAGVRDQILHEISKN